MELQGVYVPTAEVQQLRALLTSRQSLLKARTELVNSVRGWLRCSLRRVKNGVGNFPKKVRELCGGTLPPEVEWQLKGIETLSEQVKLADKTVKEKASKDAVCVRLMTAPGVGPVTSLRFRATVGDVKRFPSAHTLESYLGLTPGERSSGERVRKTGITKAGPSAMRWTLVEAAWAAQRFYPDDPMVRWAQQLTARRGKHVAAVALARKLAGVMYALWRDETDYDSKHSESMEHLTTA
jgi:transposase